MLNGKDLASYQNIMQYLSEQESGDMVIIKLPENRQFLRTGNPDIKQADWRQTRRQPRR